MCVFAQNWLRSHPIHQIDGGTKKFQTDPHCRDLILFYEYFHGDNGAGLGASHQTGSTGLMAKLIQSFNIFDSQMVLKAETHPFMRVYDVKQQTVVNNNRSVLNTY